MPSISLASTSGGSVDMASLSSASRAIIYCYPKTGQPGVALPDGWEDIPGARGCTPQSCSFRDHHRELVALGADVFGLSTQATDYQQEMVQRLHLPFAVLSDVDMELVRALSLPTFQSEGQLLIKRLTLIVRGNVIESVLYPVFPPGMSADQTISWLTENPL